MLFNTIEWLYVNDRCTPCELGLASISPLRRTGWLLQFEDFPAWLGRRVMLNIEIIMDGGMDAEKALADRAVLNRCMLRSRRGAS